MTTYVCTQLSQGVCQQWTENQDLLATLAISSGDATKIALAISGVLILGFIFGEIGHMIKVSFTSRF